MSNVKQIVEAKQYLFNVLWDQATPAYQRIREIEEGVVPDFIKTMRDFIEIQKLAFELLDSSEHEVLIIFFYSQCISSSDRTSRSNAVTKRDITNRSKD